MPAYVPSAPGTPGHAITVTPSDTTVYNPPLKALWIGTASSGALAILAPGDTVPVTLAGMPAGWFSAIAISKVMATNTTGLTGIIGFY